MRTGVEQGLELLLEPDAAAGVNPVLGQARGGVQESTCGVLKNGKQTRGWRRGMEFGEGEHGMWVCGDY